MYGELIYKQLADKGWDMEHPGQTWCCKSRGRKAGWRGAGSNGKQNLCYLCSTGESLNQLGQYFCNDQNIIKINGFT